jgi:hypothetical protein
MKPFIFAKEQPNCIQGTEMKGFLFQTAGRNAITLILLAACFAVKGQEASEEDFNTDAACLVSGLTQKPDPNTLKTPEISKVSFSFTTGMMLGTAAGSKNNFAAAYIAPAVAYNISPRLRVRAGGLIFFNSFYNPAVASTQTGESSAGRWNNMALFVAADYFVTDRMTITGSYYKMPENNLFRQSTAPEVYNRYGASYTIPSESMSLGLNYKIAKGFYIGAGIMFSNGYQPTLNPYPLLPGNIPYY